MFEVRSVEGCEINVCEYTIYKLSYYELNYPLNIVIFEY